MFVPFTPSFADRVLRVARLLRAFAFLEDPADVSGARVDVEAPLAPHPHHRRVRREHAPRRLGAIQPRTSICVTPISPRAISRSGRTAGMVRAPGVRGAATSDRQALRERVGARRQRSALE